MNNPCDVCSDSLVGEDGSGWGPRFGAAADCNYYGFCVDSSKDLSGH